MEEIWKDIPEYENLYRVSNLGRIKSLRDSHGNYREKILKLQKDKGDYLFVYLHKNKKMKACKVHRLVAICFIENQNNLPCVDHINCVRSDNRVENLRWATHKQNSNNELSRKHCSEAKKGVYNTAISKKIFCVELGQIFPSAAEAERQLRINHSSISRCCNGKRKTAGKLNGVKLHWKYVEE